MIGLGLRRVFLPRLWHRHTVHTFISDNLTENAVLVKLVSALKTYVCKACYLCVLQEAGPCLFSLDVQSFECHVHIGALCTMLTLNTHSDFTTYRNSFFLRLLEKFISLNLHFISAVTI